MMALIAGVALGLLLAALQVSQRHAGAHPESSLIEQHSSSTLGDAVRGDQAAEIERLKKSLEDSRLQLEAAQKELEAAKSAVASTSGGAAKGCPVDRHALWGPSPEREAANPELAELSALLKSIAIDNEVMAAVSNQNYAFPGGMLSVWIENVRKSGVKNAMVIALDDATKRSVEELGFPVYRMDIKIPDSQKSVGENHAVSALKFRILTNFLKLGYAVFLSDVDIVTLQNPFPLLHRDVDVESMSDGWDNGTAYGYNDVKDDPAMGWARYAHSMRIFVFNSGLFFIRPTPAAMELLEKVIYRVETENGWDQALFNECIFFPNHPGYKDPEVTRRVLDYMLFMNSKVLFVHLRHDRGRFETHRPVMVHVNYHPDKFERMKAVVRRYVDGEMTALDSFPDGSG